MNRRARSALPGALLLALSVAAASAAPLPARPGDSAIFSYELTGGQKSTGQVWVVRSTAGRVTITVSPSTEEVPGTYAFNVAPNGTLSGNATDDAPEPGIPGEAPGEMARSFAAAANLLVTATTANAALWNVEVPVPGTSGTLHFVARAGPVAGDDRTVLSDGSGLVSLVPVGGPHEPRAHRGKLPYSSPTPAPSNVDVSMHVEATLHAGILASAHGHTRMNVHGKGDPQQYDWTITAANAR